MSEYLSKEEIRRWRSSLERITLEEYAARLGKIIQEEKHDDSLVDSVMLRSLNSMTTELYKPKAEKIQSISIRSFSKEKDLKVKQDVKQEIKQKVNEIKEIRPIIEKELNIVNNPKVIDSVKESNEVKKVIKEVNKIEDSEVKQIDKQEKKNEVNIKVEEDNVEFVNYSFNKALTEREQLVFNHFLENKNSIVYAKDLAKILELPRDYVYKYIKNLRGKLNKNILQNAANGGYMLKV